MHNIYAHTFMIAARTLPEPLQPPELRPHRGQKRRRHWGILSRKANGGDPPVSGQIAPAWDS